jgi:catecholate siderophore receptor
MKHQTLRHAIRLAVTGVPLLAFSVLADDQNVERIQVVGQAQSYTVDQSSTATKTPTALKDIPQAISVITEELIDDQAMQNMSDVVRYVPGVQMQQGEGHRDAPVLRGNTSTADFFLNGVRDDVQYFRDLYNVKRVEVLKGPSGMIFGRGGAGGLINRVTKQANWTDGHALDLALGSWQQQRASADLNHAVNDSVAARVTALYEDSEGFRDYMELKRQAINPTLTFKASDATTVALSYEHFKDDRTTDRGVPSLNGRPVAVPREQFFGKPEDSNSDAVVDAFGAAVSHDFGNNITLTNTTRYADYDKFYGNVFPGAVNAQTQRVSLAAYTSETLRTNLMNQTDLVIQADLAGMRHTMLTGVELNRQKTDNQRLTGYFTDISATATSDTVPLANTIYAGSLEFRPSATDANNHSVAKTAAFYLQDQIELDQNWQAIVGLRYDRFDAELLNNRTSEMLDTTDNLLSPRAGLIYQPSQDLSFYASYSLSYVPRAGEQLASLTVSNKALDPEEFTNKEIGMKWDLGSGLNFTTALYQLDRTNVAVTDPADPTRTILVDGQQVRGLELEMAGQLTQHWQLVAGFAYQDSEIQTPTAQNGNSLAQVPKQSFSLWNRYQLNDVIAAGLGWVAQSSGFTTTDNSVTLPGFGRLDAAVFYTLSPQLRVQMNLENLLDKTYYASAHNNNNITPGTPRAYRVGLSYKF